MSLRLILQDIQEIRAAETPKGKRIGAAKAVRDTGIFWLDYEEGGTIFFATPEDEADCGKLCQEVASLIEDLGGTVPSYSTSTEEVGANLTILKMLLPILLKILADRFTQED